MPMAGSGRFALPAEPSKSGVAVVEDAPVRRDEPVALAVPRRRHADDRRVQVDGTRAAEELRVAIGEDPAVGGHEPVALAVRRRCHAHDRLVQALPAHRSVELRVAVGEYAAVERAEPVPLGVVRGGLGHDRSLQGQGTRGAFERRVAEREDAAVCAGEDVAVPVGRGGPGEHGRVERLRHGGRARVDGPEPDHPGVAVDGTGRCRHQAAAPNVSTAGATSAATVIAASETAERGLRRRQSAVLASPPDPPSAHDSRVCTLRCARTVRGVTKSLRIASSTRVQRESPRSAPANGRFGSGPTAEWVHDPRIHHGRPPRHVRRPVRPVGRRPHVRDLRHQGPRPRRAPRHRPGCPTRSRSSSRTCCATRTALTCRPTTSPPSPGGAPTPRATARAPATAPTRSR